MYKPVSHCSCLHERTEPCIISHSLKLCTALVGGQQIARNMNLEEGICNINAQRKAHEQSFYCPGPIIHHSKRLRNLLIEQILDGVIASGVFGIHKMFKVVEEFVDD